VEARSTTWRNSGEISTGSSENCRLKRLISLRDHRRTSEHYLLQYRVDARLCPGRSCSSPARAPSSPCKMCPWSRLELNLGRPARTAQRSTIEKNRRRSSRLFPRTGTSKQVCMDIAGAGRSNVRSSSVARTEVAPTFRSPQIPQARQGRVRARRNWPACPARRWHPPQPGNRTCRRR